MGPNEMLGTDAESYWLPICELLRHPRCWLRVAWTDRGETTISRWGQGLGIPVEGYLEGPGGPVPTRNIAWVQVMPVVVRGGLAGRPLEFVEVHDEVIANIRGTNAIWTFREEHWSVEGIFESRAGTAIQITNPFRSDA